MTICSEKPLQTSVPMRALSHNRYAGYKKSQSFLCHKWTNFENNQCFFIMEMEYANDSSISEAEELNIHTLVLPYQFKPPASCCFDNTAECSFRSDTNDEDIAINELST